MKIPEPFMYSHKILFHADRLAEWIEGSMHGPITLEIDITNRCNQNCEGCTGYFGENTNQKMELDEYYSIITEARNLGVRGIVFKGGGEPTLHPDLTWMLMKANQSGFRVGLITNGSMLHKLTMTSLLNYVTWIRIGLDAGTKEMYQRTHGVDSFHRTMTNITTLCSTRNDMSAQCTIGTAYLTGGYRNDADEMLKYVLQTKVAGCDYAQFRPFDNAKPKGITQEEIEKVVKLIEPLMEHSSDSFQIVASMNRYRPIINSRPLPKKCYAPYFVATVGADMKLYTCCHKKGIESHQVADLRGATFTKAWFSRERADIIENINPKACTGLCRHKELNEILNIIAEGGQHSVFL